MKEYRYFMRSGEEKSEFIREVRKEMRREGVRFRVMNCRFNTMLDALQWAENNYFSPVALPVGNDLVVVY